VTASGEDLEILGEIRALLRIEGFSWKWKFLVSKKLTSHIILVADFINKSRMVLDLARARCYFSFAPIVIIPLSGHAKHSYQVTMVSTVSKLSQIRTGRLSTEKRKKSEFWWGNILTC
jgi:hypothetical protein